MSSEARVVQPAPPRIANGRFAPASSVRRASSQLAPGSAARRGTAVRPALPTPGRACPPAARARPGRAGPRTRPCRRARRARGCGRRCRSGRPTSRAGRTSAGSRPPGTPRAPPARGDLADEQDQRRRVLVGGVHADGGLRRAGPARDHADPRPAGQLAVGLGRIRGARFVPARDQADRRLVQPVEQLEVALAGDAERELRAVDRELVGQQLAAAPAHSRCSR